MLTDTIGEEDGELEEDLSPVLNTSRPFADNVHGRQIEHFEKGFISRKNAFTLCDFSKLTVVTLDHVRRVDKLTDLRRILEERSRASQLFRQANIRIGKIKNCI